MKNYLLDAFPVLCWLQEEPGHNMVGEMFTDAEGGNIALLMNMMNLGEVFYRVCRMASVKKAEDIISKIRLLPITFVSVSDAMIMDAARIKGKYPVSYADAFAIVTAIKEKATIITADPEYKAVSKLVKVLWIR